MINRKKLIYSDDRISFFRKTPDKEKGFLLNSLPKKIQKEIIFGLKNNEIIDFLETLDFDDATDLLQIVDKKKRNELLNLLEKDKREKITKLLGFDETTAGGLINIDYIQVDINSKINSILKIANLHEKKLENFQ
jgi:magnesium transporter